MLSCFSRVWFFTTLWTVAHQAPLSMGFSRQAYWSGWPFPPPVDLPDLGIEPASLMSPALAGGFFTTSATWDCTILGDPERCQFKRQVLLFHIPSLAVKKNKSWRVKGRLPWIFTYFPKGRLRPLTLTVPKYLLPWGLLQIHPLMFLWNLLYLPKEFSAPSWGSTKVAIK